jgi:hypothetical protein
MNDISFKKSEESFYKFMNLLSSKEDIEELKLEYNELKIIYKKETIINSEEDHNISIGDLCC